MAFQRIFLAHTAKNRSPEDGHPLSRHLSDTARRARAFAAVFEAASMAGAGALLHDAGKFREAFQVYLQDGGPSAEHSVCGALMALDRYAPPIARILAYVIAGHHAGLPNGGTERDSDLDARLQRGGATLEDMAPWPEDLPWPIPEWPRRLMGL
ncbi:MAG: CRISPR-associated endonuclease Cas3'', partial [Rhodospirillales bacterium]|nr:CRISPR-associated endonuclease Cas3'' [Rhodospirillales bacterium]